MAGQQTEYINTVSTAIPIDSAVIKHYGRMAKRARLLTELRKAYDTWGVYPTDEMIQQVQDLDSWIMESKIKLGLYY